MNIKNLNNLDLDTKIKTLIQDERNILHEILEHIREADRRRLYLDFAFPSLFAYLTEGCRYSAGAAQRRIDAARLMNTIPGVGVKIENGELNLAQVTLLQKSLREKEKISGSKLLLEDKKAIVADLLDKNVLESQLLISKALDLPIQQLTKQKYQKDESIRLELTFNKEQWKKIIRMRELLSTSVHSGSWQEVFEYLAEKVIKQKEKISGDANMKTEKDGRKTDYEDRKDITATVAVKTARKYISSAVKKEVLNRDKTCRFRDERTGKVCGSSWNLQNDHIQPKWANGSNEPENLRLVCQRHNVLLYRRQAGIKSV